MEDFSPQVYNSLPEVELANENIKSKKVLFDKFLEKVSALSEESNFSELIGLRLIHKHHAIKNNEAMAETYETFENEESLVTRPVNTDNLLEYAPSSWIYSGGKMQVFEYSKDQRVKNGYKSLQENSRFLSSFLDLLQAYEMQNLVAFAILDREWYGRLSGKVSFNEISYESDDSFMSVVRPEKTDLKEFSKDYIKTAWILNLPISSRIRSNITNDNHVEIGSSPVPYSYGCYLSGYYCHTDRFSGGHQRLAKHSVTG